MDQASISRKRKISITQSLSKILKTLGCHFFQIGFLESNWAKSHIIDLLSRPTSISCDFLFHIILFKIVCQLYFEWNRYKKVCYVQRKFWWILSIQMNLCISKIFNKQHILFILSYLRFDNPQCIHKYSRIYD